MVLWVEDERMPDVAAGKRRVVDTPEQVVGKRVRLSSHYVVSPFTTEAKRRTFIDVTWPIYSVRWTQPNGKHSRWSGGQLCPASRVVGERTISDAYKWFHDITTSRTWLADNYIDLAMDLLRDRARRYPRSFDIPGRLILSTEFVRTVTIKHLSLQRMGHGYALPEYIAEWVVGMLPSLGRKAWEACTHLYVPAIVNHHTIALEIVFANSTMYVYDSDHSCLTRGLLEQQLEPLSLIVPLMARRAGVIVNDKLDCVRDQTTSRQSRSGDYGIFAIKYIEFLSIGHKVDGINQAWIQMEE